MQINRQQLFIASCLALMVTGLSFGIRAGILDQLGVAFQLDKSQLASITATAFWGFPLAIVIGGLVVDIIGMKKLLVAAFIFHFLGIILTVFASGFWTLFLSTLLVGLANGTVEAACNPLVAGMYTEEKTTKLNHFHLWFPSGIVIGTVIAFALNKAGIGWQVQVGTMLIPTIYYGYLFSKLDFPVTERVASGVSYGGMIAAVANPLFIVMFILMFGTAITELFTGQWINVLLKNVTDNALLLLTLETGVMVLGRAFAKPVLKMITPQALLVVSAALAALGIFMFTVVTGPMLYLAAIIFGMGVCFFWPTMLGFVNTNLPKTGALGLNLMGGAGMFAVSIFTLIMGDYYDSIQKSAGGNETLAGQAVLKATLVIPIFLVVAFVVLVMYMKGRSKKTAAAVQA
ncbi:MFS transporter [Mucilaginibacter calamicampi]|uniref:MFS transporter n=1 Tax=Mucilaginibacter calamicampi TaxID=1302352 RepID=A0ABW2YV67_9SPHI